MSYHRAVPAAVLAVLLAFSGACGTSADDDTSLERIAELEAEVAALKAKSATAAATTTADATTTTTTTTTSATTAAAPPAFDACQEWLEWGWPEYLRNAEDVGWELYDHEPDVRLADGHPYDVDGNRGCVGAVTWYHHNKPDYWTVLAVCVDSDGGVAYSVGDTAEEAYESCKFTAS